MHAGYEAWLGAGEEYNLNMSLGHSPVVTHLCYTPSDSSYPINWEILVKCLHPVTLIHPSPGSKWNFRRH